MKKLARLVSASALALGLAAPATAAAAEHTLRLATLAPKNSSWGKIYDVWSKAVTKKTDGRLEMQMFYNGVQGNEDAMVSKMRTGQLDGAAITSLGLSLIHKSVLVLQLPGVVQTWDQLDQIRKELGGEVDAGIRAAGFNVVGWGDVGLVRQFSKGFEVHVPADVKGHHPAVWRNEPMGPAVYSTIGNVVPVPVDAMEVLPTLRSGSIDMINAPALAAEQLQWTPYLDHVTDQVTVTAVGGLVFRQDALDKVPADLKATFEELQKKASAAQLGRIRKLDAEAYERTTTKMKVVHISDAEKEQWADLLRKVVTRLAHGTYDKDLVNRVLKLRGHKPVE
ncbi:MAG: TRAP transporter substrate-binding protein DctP [Deltaproteobacteria bacterium]|nr:TRAP transporter substrate-binding protein DctP [Deltaproteobacteria bacterium]